MTREEERNQIAHKIAWESTKHYDPTLSKESWCEMAARTAIDWADEHPDLYSVTRKAVERERKHLIEKACKWLKHNFNMPDDFESHLKRAMEEQQ